MVVISGSGFAVPKSKVSNSELTTSFNAYLSKTGGGIKPSCPKFIEEASGIQNRYVIDKEGILDVQTMHPKLSSSEVGKLSIQAGLALAAAKNALEAAGRSVDEIDGVIVACSSFERCYPAIAIEVQHHLGMKRGWAFDMNVACSSGVFAVHNAFNMIKAGSAKSILVICPELYTANINYKDRRSHFIFGDAASAVLVESEERLNNQAVFQILDTNIQTSYSCNIYNNFGVLNRKLISGLSASCANTYFNQDGRRVKEEVTKMVAKHIKSHVKHLSINLDDIKRLWLHQANIHMNKKIASAINSAANDDNFSPVILNDYGNTGAAGIFITFNKYSQDLAVNDIGVLCAFGAGYGVGSVLLQKIVV